MRAAKNAAARPRPRRAPKPSATLPAEPEDVPETALPEEPAPEVPAEPPPPLEPDWDEVLVLVPIYGRGGEEVGSRAHIEHRRRVAALAQ